MEEKANPVTLWSQNLITRNLVHRLACATFKLVRRQSLAESIKTVQRQLAEARKRVSDLEAELAQAQAALGAPTPSVTVGPGSGKTFILTHHVGRMAPVTPVGIKSGSTTDWAKKALEAAGHEMTIDQVIQWAFINGGIRIQKPTLASNLSRYIRRGDTFSRVGKNTIALLEWDQGREMTAQERFEEEEDANMRH